LSCTRPKHLLPIANKPLLDWTITHLKRSGVRDIILAIGYMGKMIRSHLRTVKGVNISFSKERRPLGTGGAVKNARRVIGDGESFLVLNGDVLTFPDIKGLVSAHKDGTMATITVYPIERPERFGVMVLDKDGVVRKFVEKPRRRIGNLINAGVYMFAPRIFDFIPNGRVSLERDVFPKLCQKRLLSACQIGGIWVDIGLPEDYLHANRILTEKVGRRIAKGADISPAATIKGPVIISEGTRVMDGAVISGPTSLGSNVVVEEEAVVDNSVIFDDVVIGDGASIRGAAVGEGAVIGARARLKDGCIVGDESLISDSVVLAEDVRVCPYKEVRRSVLKAKSIVV
ncbi:TPA: NDP-sugar synthase, partial [Candidatus Bathyarchaeota archaeon]|nr:NDP-sugar synthase [Candidatus Bathyarchaeota archaeon]